MTGDHYNSLFLDSFLDAGADPHIRNNEGKNAFDLANDLYREPPEPMEGIQEEEWDEGYWAKARETVLELLSKKRRPVITGDTSTKANPASKAPLFSFIFDELQPLFEGKESPSDIFDQKTSNLIAREGDYLSEEILRRIAEDHHSVDYDSDEFGIALYEILEQAEALSDESLESRVWARLEFISKPKHGVHTLSGLCLGMDGTDSVLVFHVNSETGRWSHEVSFPPGTHTFEGYYSFSVPEGPISFLVDKDSGKPIKLRDAKMIVIEIPESQ